MYADGAAGGGERQQRRLQKVVEETKRIAALHDEEHYAELDNAVEEQSEHHHAGKQADGLEAFDQILHFEDGVDNERRDADRREQYEPSEYENDDVVGLLEEALENGHARAQHGRGQTDEKSEHEYAENVGALDVLDVALEDRGRAAIDDISSYLLICGRLEKSKHY